MIGNSNQKKTSKKLTNQTKVAFVLWATYGYIQFLMLVFQLASLTQWVEA